MSEWTPIPKMNQNICPTFDKINAPDHRAQFRAREDLVGHIDLVFFVVVLLDVRRRDLGPWVRDHWPLHGHLRDVVLPWDRVRQRAGVDNLLDVCQ